jgi:YHS domain-containing protein
VATVTDPVCGMKIDSSQAAAQTTYEGQAYYFCSTDCRDTFEQSPRDYVGNASRSPTRDVPEQSNP